MQTIKTRYHYKNQQRDIQTIAKIWRDAKRYWWSREIILERCKAIWDSEQFKKQPIHAKEFIRGYCQACFDLHWDCLVYSYNCGEHGRLSIESAEYKAIPPYDVHKLYSDTGCYVYRDNLNAAFS